MSIETIERSFDVASPARLNLGNIRGLIELKAGEDGVISIKAVKHLKSGDEANTNLQITQEEDGRVIVKTDYENSIGNLFGLRKPMKVDYTVQLPKECEIKVSGVSCLISAKGLHGNIDINSVSGKLTLEELSGILKLSVVSGAIDGQKLSGEFNGNSVSGRIRIIDSNFNNANIKSVSGKMVVETPINEGPYVFNSVSGALSLIVPQESSCTAQIKSVSGRLRTSLPITKDKRKNSRGFVEIAHGGPEVTYKSVSGSMRIVTSEKEEIVERIAPEKPVEQEKDKIAILQKIERGEISVDEALEELNA